MVRRKTSPCPLSQTSVTGEPGVSGASFSARQTVSRPGIGLRHAAARHPAVLRVIGVRRAGGREQHDVGRRGIDRLVVLGQHQIVDAPARRARSSRAGSASRCARAGSSAIAASRVAAGVSGAAEGTAAPGCGTVPGAVTGAVVGAARLLLDLALLLLDALPALLVLLQLGAGIEHLPDQQHAHRQHDGEKEVLLVVLVAWALQRFLFGVFSRVPAHRTRAGRRGARGRMPWRARSRGQRTAT